MSLYSRWQTLPDYTRILLAAALVRLVAVILSQGYAMHDDHFLVVEVAQSWANAEDVYGWFNTTWDTYTTGRSPVYPGFHYLIFSFCDLLGLADPKIKMFVIRLLHAALSLWAVSLSYRLALRFAGERAARQVGWLMALLWLLPYISVRNLAEVVCIPFLMAGTWWAEKSREPEAKAALYAFWAGMWMGLAFSFRYQAIFFGAGVFLAFLWLRKWRQAFFCALGMAVPIALLHGVLEWWIWGHPFGKVWYYVQYNILNATEYITQPWYNFLLLLAGLMLPLSLGYWWGVVRARHIFPLLFGGFMLFFIFHSYFPNKQERFIFTVIPAFIVLGVAGWQQWTQTSAFWQQRASWLRLGDRFFWVLNTLALVLFTSYYPKQGRVEAMYYFYEKKGTDKMIVENIFSNHESVMPTFYMGKRPDFFYYTQNSKPDDLRGWYAQTLPESRPQFVLLVRAQKLDERLQTLQTVLPPLELVYHAKSNFMDRLLHWLNPLNRTEDVLVYKIKDRRQ